MSFKEEDFFHLQEELLKLRDENYELKNRCQQKETQAGDLSRQLQSTSKKLSKAENVIQKSRDKKETARLLDEIHTLKRRLHQTEEEKTEQTRALQGNIQLLFQQKTEMEERLGEMQKRLREIPQGEDGESELKETDGDEKNEYVDGWELVREICEMWEIECPSENVQRNFIQAVDHARRKRDKKITSLEESLQQKEAEAEEVKDELDGLKEQHKIWESELIRKQKEMEDDLAAMARRLQRREERLNKYRETIRSCAEILRDSESRWETGEDTFEFSEIDSPPADALDEAGYRSDQSTEGGQTHQVSSRQEFVRRMQLMKDRLDGAFEKCAVLEDEKAALMDHIIILDSQLATAKEQHSRATTVNSELEEDIKKLLHMIEELRSEKREDSDASDSTKILEDLQHKSEVIRELELQNRELQENLRVIEIQHLQERRRLKDDTPLSASASSLSIDVPDDATEEHNGEEESERTGELEQELESLQARLLGKEKEIEELTENADKLSQEMEQKSSEYQQKFTDLEDEKRILEEKVHRFENESRKMQIGVEDMQDIVKRTNKQLSEIKAEKKALQERINELREESHAQKTQEGELIEDIRKLKTIIENHMETIEGLEDEKAQMSSDLLEAFTEIKELQKSVTEEEEKFSLLSVKMQTEVDKLRNEIQEHEDSESLLRKELAEKESSCESMKKKIESLQVALEDEKEQHKTEKDEIAMVQHTTSQTRIDLEKSLETLKIENDGLVKEIESMRQTLKSVENDKDSLFKHSKEQQLSLEELKNEAKQSMESYAQKVKELQDVIASKSQDLESCRIAQTAAKEDLARKQATLEHWKENYERLRKEHEDFKSGSEESATASATIAIQNLQEQLDEANEKLVFAQRSLEEETCQRDKKEKENVSMKHEQEDLTARISDLEKSEEETNSALVKKEQEMTICLQEKKETEERALKLEGLVSNLEGSKKDLEKTVEDLKGDMTKLQNSYLIAQDKYEGVKDELAAMDENISTLREEKDQLLHDIKNFKIEEERLKGKIEELSFACTKSESTLVHLKEEYASYRSKYSEDDFASLQSRIVELEEDVDALQKSESSLNDERNAMLADMQGLLERERKKEEQMQEQKKSIKDLQKKISEQEVALAERKSRIDQMHDDIGALNERCREEMGTRSSLEKEKDNLKRRIGQLESSVHEKEQEIHHLREKSHGDKVVAAKEHESLTSEQARLQERVDSLQHELQSLRLVYRDLERENDAWKIRQSESENEVRKRMSENDHLKKTHTEKVKELEKKHKDSVTKLQAELEDAQSKSDRINKKYSQMKVIMLQQQDALSHVKSVLPHISSMRKEMQSQWASLLKDYSSFREVMSKEFVEVRMRICEQIEAFLVTSDAHELKAFAKQVVCSAGLQASNELLLDMSEKMDMMKDLSRELDDMRQKNVDLEAAARISERRQHQMVRELKEQLQRERKRKDSTEERMHYQSRVSQEGGDGDGTDETVNADKKAMMREIYVLGKRLGEIKQKNFDYEERIRMFEEHIVKLKDDNDRKSKIITAYTSSQHVVPPSSSQTASPAKWWSPFRKSGPTKAEEIQKKAQTALEETLLRNMQLQSDVKVLGEEIARLMQENEALRGGEEEK